MIILLFVFFLQIKGKISNISSIIDELHRILPLVNFDILIKNYPYKNLNQTDSDEREILSRTNLSNCIEQQTDLLNSYVINLQYSTTEKQINTDEQGQCRIGEQFRPLTDSELDQELDQFCTKFDWKHTETVLDKSFDAPIVPYQASMTV